MYLHTTVITMSPGTRGYNYNWNFVRSTNFVSNERWKSNHLLSPFYLCLWNRVEIFCSWCLDRLRRLLRKTFFAHLSCNSRTTVAADLNLCTLNRACPKAHVCTKLAPQIIQEGPQGPRCEFCHSLVAKELAWGFKHFTQVYSPYVTST